MACRPEPKVCRNLIVTAASRVQLAARVANQLDEPRLDKRVNVLRLRIVRATSIKNRVQTVTDSNSFVGSDNTRVFERLAVRHAGSYVRFKQPAVETKRIIESRKAGIGFALNLHPHKSKVSLTTTNSPC